MQELDKCGSKLRKIEPGSLKKGSIVAAEFSEDGAIYRAIIKDDQSKAKSRAEISVLFCDYGNSELVPVDGLMQLPEHLAKEPATAVEVIIEGNEKVADTKQNRQKVEGKLDVEGLQVKITENEIVNGFSAKFGVKDKKIKFKWTEEELTKEVEAAKNEHTPKANQVSVPQPSPSSEATEPGGEIVKPLLETPKSSGKHPTMCSQLPSLKLLEQVNTTGSVVYVSPIGSVYFTPSWILSSLDDLNDQIDKSSKGKGLKSIESKDICIGLLCIACNSKDGDLYRARVVDQLKNGVCSVKYIDFGDNENLPISSLFYFPAGLPMIAPAAAEVVLANPPPSSPDLQTVLEDTLMEADLVLVMEKDESGVVVGKFLKDGNEITWEGLIDAKKVFDKDQHQATAEEDVVIETEELVKAKNPAPEPKVQDKKSKSPDAAKKRDNEGQTKSKIKAEVTPKKLGTEKYQAKKGAGEVSGENSNKTKMEEKPSKENPPVIAQKPCRVVPPVALAPGLSHDVFLNHVESVSKVWVCRVEDEEKVTSIMARLKALKGKTDNLFLKTFLPSD